MFQLWFIFGWNLSNQVSVVGRQIQRISWILDASIRTKRNVLDDHAENGLQYGLEIETKYQLFEQVLVIMECTNKLRVLLRKLYIQIPKYNLI